MDLRPFEAVGAPMETGSMRRPPTELARVERVVDEARNALGESSASDVGTAGHPMSLEAAVEEAMAVAAELEDAPYALIGVPHHDAIFAPSRLG